MSREECAALLRNLQLGLDGLQKEVDDLLGRLPEVKTADLGRALASQKERLQSFVAEQAEEWDRFMGEAGLQASGDRAGVGEVTPPRGGGGGGGAALPFPVQLQSLEQRVAAMGGIPALGSCVLPRPTPDGSRATLQATASPAALEMLRAALGTEADAAVPLRAAGGGGGQQASHTPLVPLRKVQSERRSAGALQGGDAAAGQLPPNSELASAMQQRLQRAAATPDAAPNSPLQEA